MRAPGRIRDFERSLAVIWTCVWILGGAVSLWSANPSPQGGITNNASLLPESTAPRIRSLAAAEVLRLWRTNTTPSTVTAYIKKSTLSFNSNPDEIIALKERGVPADVITALIQRGDELKAQEENAAGGWRDLEDTDWEGFPWSPTDWGIESVELCRQYFYPWYGYDYFWPEFWGPFYAVGCSHSHHHEAHRNHHHSPTAAAFGTDYRGPFGIRQPVVASMTNGRQRPGTGGLFGPSGKSTRDAPPKSSAPSKNESGSRQPADSSAGSTPSRNR